MENLGLIIALSGSAFTIIAAMIALMLWVRSEANADRRDIVGLIIAIKEDVQAIQLEIKDFHTRIEKQDADFKMKIFELQKSNYEKSKK